MARELSEQRPTLTQRKMSDELKVDNLHFWKQSNPRLLLVRTSICDSRLLTDIILTNSRGRHHHIARSILEPNPWWRRAMVSFGETTIVASVSYIVAIAVNSLHLCRVLGGVLRRQEARSDLLC